MRPGGRALHIAQHRIREKSFLAEPGLPVTPFAPVRSEAELRAAVARIGCPAVLKTATLRVRRQGAGAGRGAGDASAAWQALGRQEAILEAFIDLDREISVVGARGVDGECPHFGPIENAHRHHILDVSVAAGRGAAATAAPTPSRRRAACWKRSITSACCASSSSWRATAAC